MNKEIVVHVTTLEQWKSVLDIWFGKGYRWLDERCPDYGEDGYEYFGSRQLALNIWGDDEITCFGYNNYNGDNLIEYSDFMAQREKING